MKPALEGLDTEKLVLSTGAQAAIFGILLSCTTPGDTVLSEPLTYPGFLVAARQLGLRVTAVESDEDGIVPEALERCHSETNARLLYLNPTLNNPTTKTTSAERRQQITASLRRLEITLIEDDPYRNLIKDPPPPLATFTRGEQTYYVASLSKCLWPTLQTALVLPPARTDSSPMLESLRAATMTFSPLLAGLSEQWIRSGIARQFVQEIQRQVRARQTLARSMWAPPLFCTTDRTAHLGDAAVALEPASFRLHARRARDPRRRRRRLQPQSGRSATGPRILWGYGNSCGAECYTGKN